MGNKPRTTLLSRLWKFLRHAKAASYKVEENAPTSYGVEWEFDWADHQGKTFETKAPDVVAAPNPSKKSRHE